MSSSIWFVAAVISGSREVAVPAGSTQSPAQAPPAQPPGLGTACSSLPSFQLPPRKADRLQGQQQGRKCKRARQLMGAGNLLWLCHHFPGSEKGRKQGAAWVDPGALGKMRLSAGTSHISRGCLCLLTLPHSACIHLFFSWIFLFHKTRIAFCSVYPAQPRGAPGQGLLDVTTSHNNSRNGSRALCLSQHQDLCLKVGGRACKTEFTAQIRSRCNRSVAQGDTQRREWAVSVTWWYPTVRRQKKWSCLI